MYYDNLSEDKKKYGDADLDKDGYEIGKKMENADPEVAEANDAEENGGANNDAK